MVMSLKACKVFPDDSDCKFSRIEGEKMYLEGNDIFLEKTIVNLAIHYDRTKEICLTVVDYLFNSIPLQVKFTANIREVSSIERFFNFK